MRGLRFMSGAVVGAGLAFFLDPDRGRRRRALVRDQVAAVLRRGTRRADRAGRYLGGVVQGTAWRVRHPASETHRSLNDQTLAQKVRSVIFRDPAVPKGHINVNAEDGVIVLRGQVADAAQIQALEDLACAIPGVRRVENLLHLPDTPAPSRSPDLPPLSR